jgi:hypothetical protein
MLFVSLYSVGRYQSETQKNIDFGIVLVLPVPLKWQKNRLIEKCRFNGLITDKSDTINIDWWKVFNL